MKIQEDVRPEISSVVNKGRRTKRQRVPHLAMPPAPPPPEPIHILTEDTTSTSASDFGSITEEDEDVASCLILLAQGDRVPYPDPSSPAYVGKIPDSSAPISYECKMCNKTFSSFQALGGHRASHKKSKLSPTHDEKKLDEVANTDTTIQMSSTNAVFPVVIGISIAGSSSGATIKANKIHKCSICGVEFNSGQALGGHMRRHRPLVVASTETSSQEVVKKEKSLLEIDLNLLAEEATEEVVQPEFPLATEKVTQLLLFRSSLVDCHL